jgi:hypothetical protein
MAKMSDREYQEYGREIMDELNALLLANGDDWKRQAYLEAGPRVRATRPDDQRKAGRAAARARRGN